MKVDGIYTIRFLGIKLVTGKMAAGPIRNENGRVVVEVSYDYKIIKWRRLIYRVVQMFACVLDIQLPETTIAKVV